MTSGIKSLIISQALFTLNFGGPIFTIFLLAKGFSLQQILTLASILLISRMLFEIPTGVFADRYGRKFSMIVGGIISVLGWSLWLFVDSFSAFIFINILFGLSGAFWSGSDEALIYDELKSVGKEKDVQKIFSRYSGAMGVSFAVASIIGGIIAHVHTLEIFYVLYAMTLVSCIAGLLVSCFIKETKPTGEGTVVTHTEDSALRHFGEGVRLLLRNKKLLKITLFSTLTVSFALFDLYQVYFRVSQVPEAWYGFILALSSLLIATGKWYAYKLEEWFGVEKSMTIVALFPAVIWIIMSFVFHPIIAIVLFISSDVFGNVRDPIIADYQNRHIQGKYRATVLSTISLIISGYMALMLPIVGFVADKGLHYSFIFCSIVILIGFFAFRIRAHDVVATD